MNEKTGKVAALVTLVSVLAFAASMIFGFDNGSYFSSLGISWGFVPMICAFASIADNKKKAAGYTAIAFATVYAVLIAIVYFTQLTTVRTGALSAQAAQILDYSQFGLFFSLDLLGYAFMALSTFFIALTLEIKDGGDKWLKRLLLIHGVFAVTCVVLPMLGIFKPGMAGGDLTGVIVLEFWCAYFTPVCILAYRYFKHRAQTAGL